MIIVDTSVWIEFFKGHSPFYEDMSVLLADRKVLGVACIFGELLQGVRNKREEEVILSFWKDLPKISPELFEKAWIEAGRVSWVEKWYTKGVGLIDAVLLYLAQTTDAKLWTLDKEMNRVAGKRAIKFSG